MNVFVDGENRMILITLISFIIGGCLGFILFSLMSINKGGRDEIKESKERRKEEKEN